MFFVHSGLERQRGKFGAWGGKEGHFGLGEAERGHLGLERQRGCSYNSEDISFCDISFIGVKIDYETLCPFFFAEKLAI